MNRIKLLSLDQSTSKTGIALHCGGKLAMYDLIDLDKEKVDISERMPVMIGRICSLIHKLNPDCIVFEGVALQYSSATLILLARLQGAIIGYCVMHKIPYNVLMPSNWRKALGFTQGKGIKRQELKRQAKDYVKSKYGLTLKEDVCEAVCIGDAFIKMNNK